MNDKEPIKFHRPPNNDEFKQSKIQKDMLAYKVLYGYPNNAVYALFNPHLADRAGKLNKAGQDDCRQFFSHPNNIAYMEALKAHLSAVMGGANVVKSDTIDDTRKDRALKSLLNQAMSLVESGTDLDADTVRTIADVFKRLGVLKDEVETEIRPLRFLPERCFQGCRYRLFVENAVKGGDLIDECQYCRALRHANENGYKDSPTNRLDIPKEILDAEPENTVSTLDIINGKIEN